ncbi:unnamed protein product [Camellia sinensis]
MATRVSPEIPMAKSSPVSALKAYWFPLILFVSSMFYQLLILPRSYPPSHYDVLGIKRYSSMEQVTETYEKFSSKCPKGIYMVQLGTTLGNLEEMFMSKVASYGETVRLIFKCRYPYRQWQATSKYKILPINDDEALNTVLSIGGNFEPPNCLDVYIQKEVVQNLPNITQMDSHPFTTLLTHGVDTTAFQSPMYESNECYAAGYTQQTFHGHGGESSSHGGYETEFHNNTQDVPTYSHHTTPVEVAGNMAETVNFVQFADSDMYGPDVALDNDENEMCDEENLLGGSDDDDDEEDDVDAPVDIQNAP